MTTVPAYLGHRMLSFKTWTAPDQLGQAGYPMECSHSHGTLARALDLAWAPVRGQGAQGRLCPHCPPASLATVQGSFSLLLPSDQPLGRSLPALLDPTCQVSDSWGCCVCRPWERARRASLLLPWGGSSSGQRSCSLSVC